MGDAAIQQVQRLQRITLGWMGIEAAGSLIAAWMGGSVTLLAFGGDGAIELISATVVLWRFRSSAQRQREENERDEHCAARTTGVLLILLAAYVVVIATINLLGHGAPEPSYVGIAILAVATVLMPLLARAKRRLSAATGSAALRADAGESILCAYLSLIGLAGPAMNALWRVPWADSSAALAITPLIVREARQALRGEACDHC